MTLEKIAAVVLMVVAAAIRIAGLEHNPPGLWQDEASTGVDAYLLWTTGRDRAGVFLPLIAASFGDYPLALYRYLAAPIVGIFGLTVTGERIVAAITGTLTVGAMGAVVWRSLGPRPALAAMLAGTFAPQWVHFSRYGSEAILMPFTLTAGWALVAYGLDGRRLNLWLGAVMLGLSAYTYHAVKIFLPLWMIGFVWMYRREVVELWRTRAVHLIGPALVFAVIVAPSVYLAVTPEGQARGRTVLAWYHASGANVARMILSNYLSYFDLGLLFAHGGPAVAQSIPGVGLWSLIELPLMAVGIFALWNRVDRRSFAVFVFYWLALGPLPGGLTAETHNVGRAIGWIPVPHIVSGVGMIAILDRARTAASAVARNGVPALLAAGWVLTGAWLVWCVFQLYPRSTQRDWQFEIGDALRCGEGLRDQGQQMIVSPHFQAAEIFARFFYGDLPPLEGGQPAWTIAEPTQVQPGKLFMFPAHRPRPLGKELCRITQRGSSEPVSYVFGPGDPGPILTPRPPPDGGPGMAGDPPDPPASAD